MIKKLGKYINEYKKYAALTSIFVILEAFLEILIPYLMSKIIDNGVEKGNMEVVWTIGGWMLLAALGSMLCGVVAGSLASAASTGFARNLRRAVYNNVQDFSFENIDKFSTAGLVTRLTTDVTNVQNAFQTIIRILVRSPIMLIFAMFMCFQINGQIGMIFVGVSVLLALALFLVISKVHPIFMRIFKHYDSMNASVQENLTGIRVVKAYVREEHETEKFHKTSGEVYQNFLRAEKIINLNNPIMMFSIYTCMMLISWVGAKLIVGSVMTTGELMSLFTYTMNIMISLMIISMMLVMVSLAKSSGERLVEVLSETSMLKNPENPVREVKDGSITFENVDFSYSRDKSNLNLTNANLQIKSGETIGILGGTGSAKSSLVQLIPRLYDVTEGSVKVGGCDVRDYDMETLRNEVAMVLQKNVLFSGTIKENLRWGNQEATDEEIIHACELAQASEFIQQMPEQYDTHIEQGGNNLSGGQKQRLCIARALLKKPKILILDDSTSAVDTKTDAMIRKAFTEAIPDTTKLIITQRISSVQDADKIIVLNDGKVEGFGNHQELLAANAIYQEVYESQVRGGKSDE